MALDPQAVTDALASVPMASGYFDRVNQHEPKNAPGRGLTCAVWADYIGPEPERSGLAATTARLTMMVRLYTSMLQEPQDSIDPMMLEAANQLLLSYSADFDLGLGEGVWIDLLGASKGHPLEGHAGYININNKVYRVITMTVPIIYENAWPQAV